VTLAAYDLKIAQTRTKVHDLAGECVFAQGGEKVSPRSPGVVGTKDAVIVDR
jgi:hypothetical protein